MRLVPKLALTLLMGVFLVVAAFTAWRVRGEVEAFDHEIRRVQRTVGITAAAALARTRTRADAIRLVQRVDASREKIKLRFVSLAPDAAPEMAPMVALEPEQMPGPGVATQVVTRQDAGVGGSDFLVTYVAAPVVDEPHGAIQLAESLAPRAAHIWRGVWSVLASSLAMVVVCGLIVASIGARMVGRPVAELIGAARRIGAGEFDVLATVQRKDEFGELGRALKSMSNDLATARQRMADETEARIRALEQLRHAERLATLGQLASVLAHEIGTPLNVIAGHAKMISTGRLGGQDAKESASAISSQCERMTQIVRRILDYARRKPPRRALVDFSDVVQQACGLLSGLAAQREVRVTFDHSERGPTLAADSGQLQQAITNIVLNAIQASTSGGTVSLAVETKTRTLESGEPKRLVVLSVEDHGEGIPEDARERIFEPFFTTKPAGEGTGLGLSVVRDIVSEHDGFVEVSSREGAGSVFRVYLPEGQQDASTSPSC